MEVVVESAKAKYTPEFINANYTYQSTRVIRSGRRHIVTPTSIDMEIRTNRNVPRLGVMLVGWGGNNGTTFTAGILANKHKLAWKTMHGEQLPNWYGSITQSSTSFLGFGDEHEALYAPYKSLLPMVDPNDIVLDGWDISKLNLAEAMARAQVIDYDLQTRLKKHMEELHPRPAVYYPDFIAGNQEARADNTMDGFKWDNLQRLQADIRDCKAKNKLDKVIVVWTGNTERSVDVMEGVNDTSQNLLAAIKADSASIAPSTIYAVASILEGCTFINGSPQNTLVPGCLALAEERGVFVAGDDFKSGQTKLKSVLVDFLVSAGIKPLSIVSYNHLGNNDGLNLSSPLQFRSKEKSKANVIDDIVESNRILYGLRERPDHTVVIKYVPTVGDSKRALDEYTSELMLGGRNTLAIHNTCQDSLLAAPIILDLAIIAELMSRIQIKRSEETEFTGFHSVLSILSYFCKAPLVQPGSPVINSLFQQRSCIENIFRACLGLPPNNNMLLEYKLRHL